MFSERNWGEVATQGSSRGALQLLSKGLYGNEALFSSQNAAGFLKRTSKKVFRGKYLLKPQR